MLREKVEEVIALQNELSQLRQEMDHSKEDEERRQLLTQLEEAMQGKNDLQNQIERQEQELIEYRKFDAMQDKQEFQDQELVDLQQNSAILEGHIEDKDNEIQQLKDQLSDGQKTEEGKEAQYKKIQSEYWKATEQLSDAIGTIQEKEEKLSQTIAQLSEREEQIQQLQGEIF